MPIIHKSQLPSVEIPDVSITEFVLRHCSRIQDRLAVTDNEKSSYTFGALSEAIHCLAGGLVGNEVKPGDVVGIMAPNVAQYALAFHAVAVAGGTITTINPTYGAAEIQFQLQDSQAKLLITVPQCLDVARTATKDTAIEEILIFGDTPISGFTVLNSWMADPINQVEVDYQNHVVVLPYSSGTTGLPKGVMLTHRNLVANICQMQHVFQYSDREISLAALPFFHIYGMQVLMNGLLANGVTAVTMQRFDLQRALQLIQDLRITRFAVVPPMVLALAKSPLVENYDLSSLKQLFSGAAPLGGELAEKTAQRIGCEVVQGYGMTELSPVTHATPFGQYRRGTSGPAVSNVQSRIVDPSTGEDQDVGGRGELWVRGPMVMKGYLNNPQATAATIDEQGWLHTGDIAELDEAGHYSFIDRIKELIKYKGFQVAPAEIEAVLLTHPSISDVAVIGIADDEAGEVPKAFVVCLPGHSVDLNDIQTLIAKHLVSYKQVRELSIIDKIPKSASGKILRRELRELASPK